MGGVQFPCITAARISLPVRVTVWDVAGQNCSTRSVIASDVVGACGWTPSAACSGTTARRVTQSNATRNDLVMNGLLGTCLWDNTINVLSPEAKSYFNRLTLDHL